MANAIVGELTLKNAARLARDSVRTAVRDAYLNDQLERLEGVPVTTLTQEIYKVALLKLVEIGTGATTMHVDGGGNEHFAPDNNSRLRALEILADHRLKEAELLLKARELDAAPSGGGSMVRAQVVTTDEMAALEAMQRAEDDERNRR